MEQVHVRCDRSDKCDKEDEEGEDHPKLSELFDRGNTGNKHADQKRLQASDELRDAVAGVPEELQRPH